LAIAVRNGMLLVNRYQALAAKPAPAGEGLDATSDALAAVYNRYSPLEPAGKYDGQITTELVLEGTRERFLPIIVTAIATALAFLPFVVFGNIPGHEIMQPMAIVVLGGLVTATLVNLYLLPALYLWLKAHPYEETAAAPVAVSEAVRQPHFEQQSGQAHLVN
jgi:Cu/Ag efflux pump CusA